MYKKKNVSGEVIADIPKLLLLALYMKHMKVFGPFPLSSEKNGLIQTFFQPAVFYICRRLGNASKQQSRHRNLYAK